MYGLLGQYLDETTIWKSGILCAKKKKINFKVVQMKFFAMHNTNQI